MPSPYPAIAPEALTLRDRLAAERTVLANERTLLAYVRTALGLLAGGAGLVHFVETEWALLVGWALIGASPLVLGVGAYRFLRVRRELAALSV